MVISECEEGIAKCGIRKSAHPLDQKVYLQHSVRQNISNKGVKHMARGPEPANPRVRFGPYVKYQLWKMLMCLWSSHWFLVVQPTWDQIPTRAPWTKMSLTTLIYNRGPKPEMEWRNIINNRIQSKWTDFWGQPSSPTEAGDEWLLNVEKMERC